MVFLPFAVTRVPSLVPVAPPACADRKISMRSKVEPPFDVLMDASEALASFQRFSRQDIGCQHRRTVIWNRVRGRVSQRVRFFGELEIPCEMWSIALLADIMSFCRCERRRANP